MSEIIVHDIFSKIRFYQAEAVHTNTLIKYIEINRY